MVLRMTRLTDDAGNFDPRHSISSSSEKPSSRTNEFAKRCFPTYFPGVDDKLSVVKANIQRCESSGQVIDASLHHSPSTCQDNVAYRRWFVIAFVLLTTCTGTSLRIVDVAY
ncbi:unnamed protein product [Protopolystoma xenopodis]|uniref:Uncharacterized protein n=1 Tax=Protopolystoma xenopodis TaxID=117903 RepID=A0A448XCC9_9PLAT|nr:unnamed protein product [Protopolystoma xenopodis]